jgi:outer membrane biosynthesis protein TonB
MLRDMSHPRRAITRLLSLSCAAAVGVAPLAGCQQIQEWTGQGKKDEPAKTDTTAAPDAKTPPTPDTKVAQPVVPAVPAGAATLETLLGLVHADAAGNFVVLRSPDAFLDLGDQAVKFFDGPAQALVQYFNPTEKPRFDEGFAKLKTGLIEARAKLAGAGVDLARGAVITQTGASDDTTVMLVSAGKPEAVKELLVALKLPDAEKTVCKAIDVPGYVACADTEAVLGAYKPGDGAARKAAAAAALPGVALDEVHMLGFFPDDGGMHVALAMPPGQAVMHVSLPADSGDAKDAITALEPAVPTTLRFARPGTGFLWARADAAALKQQQPELGSLPPPFDAAVAAWNGEVFVGGSSDPAGLQLRLGLSDVAAAAKAMDEAAKSLAALVPKNLPDLQGSKIKLESQELNLGAEKVKAVHVGMSGVPQAAVLTGLVGLTFDAWAFAADNSFALAVGVDDKNIARLTGQSTADLTLAALPGAVAEDLRAGRASFVLHVPLDALHGPTLRKTLDATLKNVPDYKPEQLRSALAVLSPISSGTLWMTENAGRAVAHVAVQGIGNNSDEEGKAALAAATAAASGGDPAALFGELVTRYGGSPRLAAYQARAGTQGPGVLAGSAVAGMVVAGALAFTLFTPQLANPDLVKELGVTPPEEKKPEEKKPAEKKPAEKKPEEKKPDEKKPDEKKPDTKTPDTKTPDTKTPDTKTPETKSGGLKLPTKRLGRDEIAKKGAEAGK